jgi:mRNA-degrading endonuclease RelE of RelBE toxin-antitoxin system
MNLKLSEHALRQIKKFPPAIKRKTQKSFKLLLEDYHHPSLKSRKMSAEDVFEARIDYHYRFRFVVDDDDILIISAGIHDVGLGKK